MRAKSCVFAYALFNNYYLPDASANPLVRNDECQSPLDVARSRGFANVVHAIEVCSSLTNVTSCNFLMSKKENDLRFNFVYLDMFFSRVIFAFSLAG